MIGGNKMHQNIKGIKKILDIKYNFAWHHLNYIYKLNYYIDDNNFGDKISCLDIEFLMSEGSKIYNISIKFQDISDLQIRGIGNDYNQIMGFEIIDKKENGWSKHNRYFINDYEDGIIEFYCSSIEVISVIKHKL